MSMSSDNKDLPEAAIFSYRNKWLWIGLGYVALIVFMALMSIDKAIHASQELGVYQEDQTLQFLGEEKAKELKEWRAGQMGITDSEPKDNQ